MTFVNSVRQPSPGLRAPATGKEKLAAACRNDILACGGVYETGLGRFAPAANRGWRVVATADEISRRWPSHLGHPVRRAARQPPGRSLEGSSSCRWPASPARRPDARVDTERIEPLLASSAACGRWGLLEARAMSGDRERVTEAVREGRRTPAP
jgi:hypothetical protein